MITKTEILHVIEEMEGKLAELREAVNEMDLTGESSTEDLLDEEVDVEAIFNSLREAWNIPVDYQPTMSLEELQQVMAEGLPENWASREIVRMREE